MRGEIQVPNDFGAEVIAVLRSAWKVLKTIVQDAREINLPAMKNFEEGERLADFILEGKMVPEPPLSELKGVWVQKLMTQLQGVKNRCFRLHFKSLGGILAMQEKIAAAWTAARAPVAAEVVEVVAAEVVSAEVIEAEVIPADVAVEPFIDAIPVEEVSEAPAIPTPVATHEPIGAPMAAFMATPPPTASVHHAAAAHSPLPIDAEVVAEVVAEVNEEPAMPAEPKADAPRLPEPEPAKLPDSPIAAIFSLDAAEIPKPGEDVFSLDAPEVAADCAPKPAVPQPAPAVPAEEIFSLDADADPAPVVGEIFSLDNDEIAMRATAIAPALVDSPHPIKPPSGVVPQPAVVESQPEAKPAFGSGSSTTMPALSDSKEHNGKAKRRRPTRPAVKITLVLPGEESPIAK